MAFLRFPNPDVLTVALRSGLVPAEVLGKPVRYARDADGGLRVEPTQGFDELTLRELLRAGVRPAAPPMTAVLALCWPELLPGAPLAEDKPREVLFVAATAEKGLALAGDLLRLGAERQRLCFPDGGGALVSVVDPPLWTLLGASDGADPELAVYLPVGSERAVWRRFGWLPRVPPRIRPGEGQLLLSQPDAPWTLRPDGPWRDLSEILEVSLPTEAVSQTSRPLGHRLKVPLRMVRGAQVEVPVLWVLRDRPLEQVDDLAATLPEEALQRILFAVTEDEVGPCVLLRARPGLENPHLEVDGRGYAPLRRLGNVYRPVDRALDPPVGRDRLKALLTPHPDEIAFLEELTGGSFVVRRLSDDAFSPLSEWVDYLVAKDEAALTPWVRSALFRFETWTVAEPPSGPSVQAQAQGPRPEAPPRAEIPVAPPPMEPARAASAARPPRARGAAAPIPGPLPPPAVVEADRGGSEQALHQLEQRWLTTAGPSDSPEKVRLWAELARANASLGRQREAGLCWVRHVWDLPPGTDRQAGVSAWLGSELVQRRQTLEVALDQALKGPAGDRDEHRLVAAALAAGASQDPAVSAILPPLLPRMALWLAQGEEPGDVRTGWLARQALSQLSGGDELLLGRARDVVLQRLQRGLSVQRDIPNFYRFVGGLGRGDRESVAALTANLDGFWQYIEKNPRTRRDQLDDRPKETRAYIQWIFAWGQARLGRQEQATRLRDEAERALDRTQAVHDVLCAMFGARVQQALDGSPAEAPLPPEVAGRINTLPSFTRYVVDRVRQSLRILETTERLDPITGFTGQKRADDGQPYDPRGPEFAPIRGNNDPEALKAALEPLMRRAQAAPPDERARLYDGIMDFLPSLSGRDALPWLDEIASRTGDLPPKEGLPVLEQALHLSGFFGRPSLAGPLVAQLRLGLGRLSGEPATQAAGRLGGSLRALRRFGLRDEARLILETLLQAGKGDSLDAVTCRVHAAGGLAGLGELDEARPILIAAAQELRRPLLVEPRLRLIRALVEAWSQAPQELALAQIGKLQAEWTTITDGFATTHSYMCRSAVEFAECIVLGYASDDLAIGPEGRKLLDEDEYLVRRRVHRDLAASENP